MLAGFGLGAGAVHELHAEATPPAYVISEIDVVDEVVTPMNTSRWSTRRLPRAARKMARIEWQYTSDSSVSRQNRVSFCLFLKIWRRRKRCILLRTIWKPRESAKSTQKYAPLRSKVKLPNRHLRSKADLRCQPLKPARGIRAHPKIRLKHTVELPWRLRCLACELAFSYWSCS